MSTRINNFNLGAGVTIDLTYLSRGALTSLRALIDAELRARPNEGLSPEEVSLIQANRWVAAIKSYRERQRCTLGEAKDVVDAYRTRVNAELARLPPLMTSEEAELVHVELVARTDR